eukprot:m51a1_g12789 hypothetical protein (482) ;mRNA; r:186-1674
MTAPEEARIVVIDGTEDEGSVLVDASLATAVVGLSVVSSSPSVIVRFLLTAPSHVASVAFEAAAVPDDADRPTALGQTSVLMQREGRVSHAHSAIDSGAWEWLITPRVGAGEAVEISLGSSDSGLRVFDGCGPFAQELTAPFLVASSSGPCLYARWSFSRPDAGVAFSWRTVPRATVSSECGPLACSGRGRCVLGACVCQAPFFGDSCERLGCPYVPAAAACASGSGEISCSGGAYGSAYCTGRKLPAPCQGTEHTLDSARGSFSGFVAASMSDVACRWALSPQIASGSSLALRASSSGARVYAAIGDGERVALGPEPLYVRSGIVHVQADVAHGAAAVVDFAYSVADCACGAHGVCATGSSRCTCDFGWTGEACDIDACASALLVGGRHAYCGMHGVCAASRCACDDMYAGERCDVRMPVARSVQLAGSSGAVSFGTGALEGVGDWQTTWQLPGATSLVRLRRLLGAANVTLGSSATRGL